MIFKTPIVSAGFLFALGIQCISKLDFSNSFSQELADEFWRILVSGLLGSITFSLVWFFIQKIKRPNITLLGYSFLVSGNLMLLMILLQDSQVFHFLVLLALMFLVSFLSSINKDNSNKFSQFKLSIICFFLFASFSLVNHIYSGNYNLVSSAQLLFSVGLFMVPVLFLGKFRKVYLVLVTFALALHSFPIFIHIYTYGFAIDQEGYYAISEAPGSEVNEYISAHLTWDICLLLIAYLVLPFLIIYKLRLSEHQRISQNYQVISLALGLCFVSLVNLNYTASDYYGWYVNSAAYQKEIDIYNQELELRKDRNTVFEVMDNGPSKDTATYVFVIGESTGRNHMGLYDYFRETNPLLSSIKDELILFDDVISPHSHTRASLSKILTFGNHEDMTAFYKEGSIIELFKSAGFKTYWLSNQQLLGDNESFVSTIANESDYTKFINADSQSKDADQTKYDGQLIPEFKNILKESHPKKFIILHLMGTHGNYSNRHPSDFTVFKESDSKNIRTKNRDFLVNNGYGKTAINEYDNAVLYNDMVMFQLISCLKAEDPYGYLLYLSDHGEEVFDSRPYFSHHETDATTFMFEVPFFVWLSPEYKRANAERISGYSHYTQRSYQADDVIHSILDLAQLSVSKYTSSKSVFSPNFVPEKRVMGEWNYDSIKFQFKAYYKDLKK